jgi:gamma-glutamylputrescine oxidase
MKRLAGCRSHVGFDHSWYYASGQALAVSGPLDGRRTADVCVIGGGYTGLSAAIELARAGAKVVVLERYRVGSGASGRNGGVLGMGQRKDQDDLESMVGLDWARHLWQLSLDANALVRSRIKEFDIDCDLKDGELTVAHKARHEQSLWDYAAHLEKVYDYGEVAVVSRDEVAAQLGTHTYYGGTLDRRAGHLHPLNLARGLARAAISLGAEIYESSEVMAMDRVGPHHVVKTSAGEVRCEHVVVACNGYLNGLLPAADRYHMPINNFMVATEPLDEPLASIINRDDVAVVDTRFVVNYFHLSRDRRLIFGGGENYTPYFPRSIEAVVRPRLEAVFPQLRGVGIDYEWGGTLSVTMNRMPKFGHVGQGIYYAEGYSGHGVAMANLGGQLIAEAILGRPERFDQMATLKQRTFPGGRWLRWPGLVAGMLFYTFLDRI